MVKNSISKISNFQISKLISCPRIYTQSLVAYYLEEESFSYQIIFSKKVKLSVVVKHKLKRQLRQLIFDLSFSQLNFTLLFLVKNPCLDYLFLQKELLYIKNKLTSKHQLCHFGTCS